MSDNLHSIFSGSECPPSSVLNDYFLKKLPEEEMHRVEQHLVDCEMCTDELEGLSRMKDPRDLDLIVEEINERILAPKGRILGLSRNYALMTAAALLVLVFGTVVIVRLIIRTQPETMMSVVVEPGPAVTDTAVKAPPPPAESALRPEEKAVHRARASEKTVNSSSSVTVAGEETEITGGVAEDLQAEVQLPEAAPVIIGYAAKRSLADSAAIQPQTVSAKKAAVSTGDQKERAAVISGIMVAEQSKAPNLMGAAMKEYEAGAWEQAAGHFEEVLATDPENMKAAYHLASCYFKENRFKKAERVLKPVLLDTAGEYHKQAIELSKLINSELNR